MASWTLRRSRLPLGVTPFVAVTAPFATSSVPGVMYRFAWLKALNSSPRNCRLVRSLNRKFLYIPASTFQLFGPRNWLRFVMFAGYGPKSEQPHTGFRNAPTG